MRSRNYPAAQLPTSPPPPNSTPADPRPPSVRPATAPHHSPHFTPVLHNKTSPSPRLSMSVSPVPQSRAVHESHPSARSPLPHPFHKQWPRSSRSPISDSRSCRCALERPTSHPIPFIHPIPTRLPQTNPIQSHPPRSSRLASSALLPPQSHCFPLPLGTPSLFPAPPPT